MTAGESVVASGRISWDCGGETPVGKYIHREAQSGGLVAPKVTASSKTTTATSQKELKKYLLYQRLAVLVALLVTELGESDGATNAPDATGPGAGTDFD